MLTRAPWFSVIGSLGSLSSSRGSLSGAGTTQQGCYTIRCTVLPKSRLTHPRSVVRMSVALLQGVQGPWKLVVHFQHFPQDEVTHPSPRPIKLAIKRCTMGSLSGGRGVDTQYLCCSCVYATGPKLRIYRRMQADILQRFQRGHLPCYI